MVLLHAHVTRNFETSWATTVRVLAYTALPSVLLSKLVSMLTATVVNVSVSSRQLWIARINAAARQNGISYSKFINGLKSLC